MLDLELEYGLDGEWEGDYESEEFLPILAAVAPAAISAITSLLKESEFEDEWEDEWEGDYEMMADTPDAAMIDRLAYLASKSNNEAEAEAFFGAIASLASQIIPKALPMINKALPLITKGIARVGRHLLSSPATKKLIRTTIPAIAEGTVKSLANHVSQGGSLDKRTVVRALASNTNRSLRHPRQARRATRRYRSYRRPRYRRPAYSAY